MTDVDKIQSEIDELAEAASKLDFVSVSDVIDRLVYVNVELGTNTDVLLRQSVEQMLNSMKKLLEYEIGEREKLM